mmetsp:Transcript_71457/g.207144  ORF Transcript_71457/g.207144 Transcript_71457/m.207144 type:complete len:245 (+) Transcript_71457:1012-1746(+)
MQEGQGATDVVHPAASPRDIGGGLGRERRANDSQGLPVHIAQDHENVQRIREDAGAKEWHDVRMFQPAVDAQLLYNGAQLLRGLRVAHPRDLDGHRGAVKGALYHKAESPDADDLLWEKLHLFGLDQPMFLLPELNDPPQPVLHLPGAHRGRQAEDLAGVAGERRRDRRPRIRRFVRGSGRGRRVPLAELELRLCAERSLHGDIGVMHPFENFPLALAYGGHGAEERENPEQCGGGPARAVAKG